MPKKVTDMLKIQIKTTKAIKKSCQKQVPRLDVDHQDPIMALMKEITVLKEQNTTL